MYQCISNWARSTTRHDQFWARFRADTKGAGVIEYALIAGLISVITMGAMVVLGEEQEETYDCLSRTIDIGEQSVVCAEIGKLS